MPVSKNEALLKSNFKNFLYKTWKHLHLPPPTKVQYDIADWLQYGPKRRIIQALRGEGKSWITSAFVVWNLYVNPQIKILVVSASKQRADDFSTFTKLLIAEMPILQHLVASTKQRDSNIAFDVGPARPAHAPSVKSVGITGQMTGSRADLIVADDVEVPNNSATQTMREKLSNTVKEFDAILSRKGGQIVYLGTPQSDETLYDILETRGYVARLWPALYPDPSYIQKAYKNKERLAPFISYNLAEGINKPGDAVDPAMFDLIDLAERKISYGNVGFALQFLLDTNLNDRLKHPLQLKDLIVMDLDEKVGPKKVVWTNGVDRILDDLQSVGLTGDRYHAPMFTPSADTDWTPYHGICMAIDPAGRGKDETAYAVVGIIYGQLYLLDAGGFTGGYDDPTLIKLAKVAKRWKVNQLVIESNFGDGMFSKLFHPILIKHHNCTIEEKRSVVQKEKRIIETLEPVMNRHKLIVNAEVIRNDLSSIIGMKDVPEENKVKYQLFYQMTRLTDEKGCLAQDDRIDALAMAVEYWLTRMDQDVDAGIKSEVEEEKLRLLRQFAEDAGVYNANTEPSLVSDR